MKQYRKDINIGPLAGHKTAPIYFPLNADDPQVGAEVVRVFNHLGKYMGWTTPETFRRYIYGQLYYKSNRGYQVETIGGRTGMRRSRYNAHAYRVVPAKTINIICRTTKTICLVAKSMLIDANDLIDVDNVTDTVKLTIERIATHTVSTYNYTNYPDPYRLIERSLYTKFEEEVAALFKRQKEEVIAFLEAKRDVHNGVELLGQLRAMGQG